MTSTGMPPITEKAFQAQVLQLARLFGWRWDAATMIQLPAGALALFSGLVRGALYGAFGALVFLLLSGR